MSLPTYLSTEFYDKCFPGVKPKTLATYNVYLKTFNPYMDKATSWIQNSQSLGAKRTKIFLAHKIHEYIPEFEQIKPILGMAMKMIRKQQSIGINMTKQDDFVRTQRYLELQKTIHNSNDFPINGMNIFGKWLPPRRREINGFISSDQRVDGVNCYERSTDTFVFVDYKNKKNESDIQEFGLSELIFINPTIRELIRHYLHIHDHVVPTYHDEYFSRKYKEENKGTINDHRHAWAGLGRMMNKMQQLTLSLWMDHKISTAIATYSF